MSSFFRSKSCFLIAVLFAFLSGCASVPMAPKEEDAKAKTFEQPSKDVSALYLYRNSFVGQALTKNISLDGKLIGPTANKVYFLKMVPPGKHTVSTQSEFSDNHLEIETEGGKNYFVRQYIKMGVFAGGANLEIVDEEQGKQDVLECELAQEPR